ncbi:MAG: cation:proton antiporter [Burkholderiales bacterium]|nr:cation:proton antiporter [Burkholderiales bacterium]
MHNVLELVLILLASAVLVVALFRTLHLPPLLGYIIVGGLIGPHALGWIPNTEAASYLAEFGIVFLMFSIGLEFSLAHLYQMRHAVLRLGLSQVLLTLAGGFLASLAVGLSWQTGLVLGAALAMSSTAIVARMLAERLQLDTMHGREVMGVLLFQDLAVVPFLVLIPALAVQADLAARLALAGGKAVVILFGILFVGQRLMRPWFHAVASRRSQELFIINVLLVTLGLAWVTEQAGLSLALGAFLAGMLIAETEYRHQVEEDIKPFREVLLGLFFVTIGMRLDPAVVGRNFPLVLFLSVVPAVAKFALITGLSRLFGSTPGTALRSGFALAQAGEFGLVIVTLAVANAVLEPELAQIVTAAMLLSMLVAPFAIQASDRLALRWSKSEWMQRSVDLHRIAAQSLATERHVILCGYGRTGQRLAHIIEKAGVKSMALDLDPERVREAAAAGDAVVYGDGSRREALVAAGAARAAALVVTFADTGAALRILHHARQLNPAMPVIVRTLDDANFERLMAAGATEVVPETFESSLMLASHALVLVGVPLRRVLRQVEEVRRDRYRLLRGFFEGGSDWFDEEESSGRRLHSVALGEGSHAAGRTLEELDLASLNVSVEAIRRSSARIAAPPPQARLEAGDVVVILGLAEDLVAAEMRLLQG